MPYYDHRDLVTDKDAFYDGDLEDCCITDVDRSTSVWYDETWKAWCYLDMETGRLLVQPKRQIKYIEFEMEVERNNGTV
jgi:hypothetical protein